MYIFESQSEVAFLLSNCRENELLKHQLKKYVGAVQALRSDLQGRSSEAAEGEKPLNLSLDLVPTRPFLLSFPWTSNLGRERLLSGDIKHVIIQAQVLDG